MIGVVGEPSSVFADEPAARVLAGAVTEALVRRDASDALVPRLAEAVPTFENGGLRFVTDDADAPAGRLVATFRIRPNARWQDGAPITSADVRFAWDEDRAAPSASAARFVADRVARVEEVDARVVRLTYRAGERWEDYALAARVMPRHLLAGASAEARALYGRAPVHAGPFAVAAWLPGFGVTLSAFPDYVLGPPSLGRIEVRFLRDRAAILDALRRGEIDVAPSPGLEADLAHVLDSFADGTERSRLQTYYTQSETIDVLRSGPRLADARVRRALELAVDRSRIVDTVFAGRARVPTSYLVAPYRAAANVGPPARADREAARALLLSAGYRPGRFGIMERDGERLFVTLLVVEGSAARLDAARLIAGDLAAVGIAAEVRERPAADIDASLARSTFDLALVEETGSDGVAATERYAGRAGAWFDVLAAAARGAADPDQRTLYLELQRLWAEARPALPLYQQLAVDVAPRTLAGVRPSPAGAPLTWNAQEWSFKR